MTDAAATPEVDGSEVAPSTDVPARIRWGVLLGAAVPTVIAGVALRLWVVHSPIMPFNSDEAITGLESLEVWHGKFRLVEAGNNYEGTLESYIAAPLLHLWHGVGPLRALFVVLFALVCVALAAWLAPLVGSIPAVTIGTICWVVSSAWVQLSGNTYGGYPTGALAMVVSLGAATRVCGAATPSWRWSALAGFGAGVAAWCHPMFGIVAAIGLAATAARHWRELRRWWAPGAVGALVGASPWVWYWLRHDLPTTSPGEGPPLTYLGRLKSFVTQLLPRALGLRTLGGPWIGSRPLSITLYLVLFALCITCPAVLLWKRGWAAAPTAAALWLAFPALAVLSPLGYSLDARFSAPFMAPMLAGLAGWVLLLPTVVRRSKLTVLVVPLVWAAVFCLPTLHREIGFHWVHPTAEATSLANRLADRGVRGLRGDYWGDYRIAYLSGGRIAGRPDVVVRFTDLADRVVATDPRHVAYEYQPARAEQLLPTLPLGPDGYDRMLVDGFEYLVPKR